MRGTDATDGSFGADAWLVIRKATYWLQRRGLDSIVATGLGFSDFAVLKLLLFTGPLPISTIGEKVFLTSGSITTSIDRLERQGFVRRKAHPTDGRTFLVDLTAAGRKTIEPASHQHAKTMGRLMSVLTLKEQRDLVRLMKKLGKHAMTGAEVSTSLKASSRARRGVSREVSAP
jgi:MarR family transcriptional regulator, 2-MHQ and catechol-resistance regulon repressor